MSPPEIIASISPSPPRRVFGTAVLVGLGGLLILIGFLRPPEHWLLHLFLIVFGALVLMQAARIWSASSRGLILTEAGLFETGGRVLARIEDIARVERGAFAFKPSNGFLLHLKSPYPRAWAPGLWWRIGRRVGVGGLISGAEGRQMADLIGVTLARMSEKDKSGADESA